MSILVDVKKYLALEEAPKQVQDYLSVGPKILLAIGWPTSRHLHSS